MEASRELDRLVAVKVLGLKLCMSPSPFPGGSEVTMIATESGGAEEIPAYSTHIAAAWEVAVKTGLFTDRSLVLSNDGVNWILSEEVNPAGPQVIVSIAPTAQLAICKAALKAVGVEV